MKMLSHEKSDDNSRVLKDAEAKLGSADVAALRHVLVGLLSLYVSPALWSRLVKNAAEHTEKTRPVRR